MASRSDESNAVLDIVAQIERSKLENTLKPLFEGSRDLEQLRNLLGTARPRIGEPVYKFTDTVKVKGGLGTFTCIIRAKEDPPYFVRSGAAVFTINEAVLTKNDIHVSMQNPDGVELRLDSRICFYPQRKFKICQGQLIVEGVFTHARPSRTRLTFLEKLRESFEFIPRELSEQIRSEIQKQAEPSRPLDNVD